ncbi:MAG: hypothetical protein R3A47_05595 [Polyangiales bacterium]
MKRYSLRSLALIALATSMASCFPYSDRADDWNIGWGVCSPKRNLNANFYPANIDPVTSWPHGTVKNANGDRLQLSFYEGTKYNCEWKDTQSVGRVLVVYSSWEGQNEASCCKQPIGPKYGPTHGIVYSGFRDY